jgi:hypothetical protein
MRDVAVCFLISVAEKAGMTDYGALNHQLSCSSLHTGAAVALTYLRPDENGFLKRS